MHADTDLTMTTMTTPTTLNNNGGEALTLPETTLPEMHVQAIDTSGWKLIPEDRILFEARTKTALDIRASKALAAKKTAKEDPNAKKSMRALWAECL